MSNNYDPNTLPIYDQPPIESRSQKKRRPLIWTTCLVALTLVGIIGGVIVFVTVTATENVINSFGDDPAAPTIDLKAAPLDEDTYRAQFSAAADQMAEGLEAIGDLGREFEANNDLMSDRDWNNRLDQAVALVTGGYLQMEALDPPASLQSAHDRRLPAYALCSQGVTHFNAGIDARNADLIDQSSREMLECQQLLLEVLSGESSL